MLQTSELNAVINAVVEGKHDFFLKIMGAYGLPVRSYVASHVVHQDVFFDAFRKLRDFRQGEDFGAWLRGIARKRIYEHFRKAHPAFQGPGATKSAIRAPSNALPRFRTL
jgi:RNA polymerase sigma-70 factor, ECF subfamily